MSYVTETLSNLIHQTAFFNLTWGNYLMIAVACVFLYLAIKKGFEPLLLVPIAFGMLLVNIYPDIMANPEDMSNGVGGLLHYFYILDEWSILPSLIFMGVGAMTDFGPLIANPISFLMGAAAQLGIYAAYFLAIFLGFNGKAAAAISIIGGADGPTSIFLAGKLGQSALMGPIAVAAYSYMSLVPIIQPPIMKLCTTEKERKIKMDQLRPVSKLEKILFPIVITIVVCLILPTTAPLVGMLMLSFTFYNILCFCTAYCISRITPKTAFNQIRHVSCESCRYLLNLLIKSLRIYTRFCKIFKCSHYCFFIFLIGYTKPCSLCLQDINFSTFIFDQMVN